MDEVGHQAFGGLAQPNDHLERCSAQGPASSAFKSPHPWPSLGGLHIEHLHPGLWLGSRDSAFLTALPRRAHLKRDFLAEAGPLLLLC